MITRKAILYGIAKGVVKIVPSPVDLEGLVCQIGESWFYFGGHTAEEFTDPSKYLFTMDLDEVVNDIYEVLCDFRCDECYFDEYAYYEELLDICGCLDQPFRDISGKIYMVWESERCVNGSSHLIASYDTLKHASDAIKKWSINLGGDGDIRNYGCELNRNGKVIKREVFVDDGHKIY